MEAVHLIESRHPDLRFSICNAEVDGLGVVRLLRNRTPLWLSSRLMTNMRSALST